MLSVNRIIYFENYIMVSLIKASTFVSIPKIVVHQKYSPHTKIIKIMKKQTFIIALLAVVLTTLQGCEVIGGIFKAGMGVGIFIVVAVIALIIFIVFRIGRNR